MKRIVYWMFPFLTLHVPAWELPTIAVMDFPIASNAIVLGEGFREDIWRDRDDLLTHDVIRVLKRSRKFSVVDRTDSEKLHQEHLILQRNRAESERDLGSLWAARYLVFGTIESVEASLEKRPIPGSRKYTFTYGLGRIRIHLRVTDTKHGEVVAAETVECSKEGNTELAMQFLEDLKNRAVIKIVNRIIDTIYPMRVAEIVGAKVFITRGVDGGLGPGDEIELIEEGQEILDPETGETLGSRIHVVCTARLITIDDHFSVAALDTPCHGLSVGMLCRLK